MQGISICGSVASPRGANYRTACVARNGLKLPCEINAVIHGVYSWHWRMHKLHMKTNDGRMNATIRTNARWLFGGDGRSSDARLERSEAANEDILVFYFQMDLQTQIQYALNIEQFDIAKQLREKLTEIETKIIRQREAKRGSSKTEAQDKALNLLRVRADLQKAIDSEKYALAAGLRDEIAKLEAESLAISAKALAYQNVKYAFRLGQKVHHKVHGYRGVICGMDPGCCESKSWMETANVEKLSKGPNQPFYQSQKKIFQQLKNQREEGLITPTSNFYFMVRIQPGTSSLSSSSVRSMTNHVMKLLGMKMTMMTQIAEGHVPSCS
ncbi:clp protease adapter protein ClpF, chloroplastic-like isoform X3 [Phragmites australis]|uniref:clp protease adapter protein ClpF, chloroplastic-like isoform X3 n=1 Tax=Phragmites australis TaxID=29695 RepID=UPI002D785F4E|nr:clp protease adapter protein ClpF, chloroplastic-like isoform X3 [Phragmites australis]